MHILKHLYAGICLIYILVHRPLCEHVVSQLTYPRSDGVVPTAVLMAVISIMFPVLPLLALIMGVGVGIVLWLVPQALMPTVVRERVALEGTKVVSVKTQSSDF